MIFETDRLILIPWTIDYAEILYKYAIKYNIVKTYYLRFGLFFCG